MIERFLQGNINWILASIGESLNPEGGIVIPEGDGEFAHFLEAASRNVPHALNESGNTISSPDPMSLTTSASTKSDGKNLTDDLSVPEKDMRITISEHPVIDPLPDDTGVELSLSVTDNGHHASVSHTFSEQEFQGDPGFTVDTQGKQEVTDEAQESLVIQEPLIKYDTPAPGIAVPNNPGVMEQNPSDDTLKTESAASYYVVNSGFVSNTPENNAEEVLPGTSVNDSPAVGNQYFSSNTTEEKNVSRPAGFSTDQSMVAAPKQSSGTAVMGEEDAITIEMRPESSDNKNTASNRKAAGNENTAGILNGGKTARMDDIAIIPEDGESPLKEVWWKPLLQKAEMSPPEQVSYEMEEENPVSHHMEPGIDRPIPSHGQDMSDEMPAYIQGTQASKPPVGSSTIFIEKTIPANTETKEFGAGSSNDHDILWELPATESDFTEDRSPEMQMAHKESPVIGGDSTEDRFPEMQITRKGPPDVDGFPVNVETGTDKAAQEQTDITAQGKGITLRDSAPVRDGSPDSVIDNRMDTDHTASSERFDRSEIVGSMDSNPPETGNHVAFQTGTLNEVSDTVTDGSGETPLKGTGYSHNTTAPDGLERNPSIGIHPEEVGEIEHSMAPKIDGSDRSIIFPEGVSPELDVVSEAPVREITIESNHPVVSTHTNSAENSITHTGIERDPPEISPEMVSDGDKSQEYVPQEEPDHTSSMFNVEKSPVEAGDNGNKTEPPSVSGKTDIRESVASIQDTSLEPPVIGERSSNGFGVFHGQIESTTDEPLRVSENVTVPNEVEPGLASDDLTTSYPGLNEEFSITAKHTGEGPPDFKPAELDVDFTVHEQGFEDWEQVDIQRQNPDTRPEAVVMGKQAPIKGASNQGHINTTESLEYANTVIRDSAPDGWIRDEEMTGNQEKPASVTVRSSSMDPSRSSKLDGQVEVNKSNNATNLKIDYSYQERSEVGGIVREEGFREGVSFTFSDGTEEQETQHDTSGFTLEDKPAPEDTQRVLSHQVSEYDETPMKSSETIRMRTSTVEDQPLAPISTRETKTSIMKEQPLRPNPTQVTEASTVHGRPLITTSILEEKPITPTPPREMGTSTIEERPFIQAPTQETKTSIIEEQPLRPNPIQGTETSTVHERPLTPASNQETKASIVDEQPPTPAPPQETRTPQVNMPHMAGGSTFEPTPDEVLFSGHTSFMNEGFTEGDAGIERTASMGSPIQPQESTSGVGHPFEISRPVAAQHTDLVNEQFLDQMVKSVRFLIRQGQPRMILRLEPPQLGRMRIELATEGSKLFVELTVESLEVKQIIDSNMSHLKENLRHEGMEIKRFDVNVGLNGGSDSHAHQNNTGSTSQVLGDERHRYSPHSSMEESTREPEGLTLIPRPGNRFFDVVV